MAIAVSDVINMHAYVPNPERNSPYPVGIWKAARTQVTDASGGVVRWTAAPPSLASAYKFLWSLEDWSAISSVTSADIGLFLEVFTGEVISRAGGTEVLRFARSSTLFTAYNPSFLGAGIWHFPTPNFIHQPGGGNLNTYIIEARNVNAMVLSFSMWGYFWNSEARRLASGPRRPLT